MINKLFYGDNLDILREHVADASIDLIYLDPPFNSNASYNILFKTPPPRNGAQVAESTAQIQAFDDTWSWGESAEEALLDIIGSGNTALVALLNAMEKFIGKNAMMAYLVMMAVRLVELHRVLKSTGSLYLHCDPTASHYLKLVLDAVFETENYVNEIIWKRSHAHSDAKQGAKHFGRLTDTIFFYSKSSDRTWNALYTAYDQSYTDRDYRRLDPDGRRYRLDNIQGPGGAEKGNPSYEVMGVTRFWRYSRARMDELIAAGRIIQTRPGAVPQYKRYLDEMPGVPLQNLWTDLPIINNRSKEGLGYPTQKPIALLERIIAASSNPGDLVLDPFCGCGTAVDAAQKLGRRWIGIDVTHLAIGLIEKRLREGYPGIAFETIGVPRDLAGAQRLASEKPHDFQNWICLKLGGYPWMGGKRGGDKGVDGYFYYVGEGGATETGVISVKAGGNVNPGMVRDLGRVMARDGHKLGLFVSAALPTKGMEEEASSHGLFETHFGGDLSQSQRYPKLQIFTLAELFQDRSPKLPPLISPNRKAARVETRPSHKSGAQGSLI